MRMWLGAVMVMLAAAASAGAGELKKSGSCTLQETDSSFDAAKVLTVVLEDEELKVEASFRGGEFFADFTLFANPKIANKSGKPLSVSYNVAFFDKNGNLVAAVSQRGDLDANVNETQLGSCLVKLPRSAFAQIASYKMVVYVEPGKKKA